MFRIQSQSHLLECFRISERDEVVLPESSRFPVHVKDYYSWVEPSGAKAYLVFSDSGGKNPIAVVFKRTSGTHGLSMCEWCHSVGGGEGVALLTANASDSRRVGIHVCSDLSCGEKIHGTPGANDFPKAGSERERMHAVLARMSKFVRQNIF